MKIEECIKFVDELICTIDDIISRGAIISDTATLDRYRDVSVQMKQLIRTLFSDADKRLKDEDESTDIASKRDGNFSNRTSYLEQAKATKRYLISIKDSLRLRESVKINEDKLQISLWPFNDFKKEYKKGNSFVHCALRDGKFLFSKCKINFNQPTSFYRYALDRITITKRNIDNIEFTLKNFKNSILGSIEREDLGYCSMHLCWAVCMFNNHLPISKYTVLKECKRYFTKKEFKSIKRTYQLYAKNNHKRIKNEIFSSLFNDLKRILKRIEKEYVRKEETN